MKTFEDRKAQVEASLRRSQKIVDSYTHEPDRTRLNEAYDLYVRAVGSSSYPAAQRRRYLMSAEKILEKIR